jgi:hypothetical protein
LRNLFRRRAFKKQAVRKAEIMKTKIENAGLTLESSLGVARIDESRSWQRWASRGGSMVAVLVAFALGACEAEPSPVDSHQQVPSAALTTPVQTSKPLPTTSGSYPGHYTVPAPANLAAAARFSVDSVDWIVDNGNVTLRYYLPLGLVGGTIEVEMSGLLPAGATSVVLRSANGTASCKMRGSLVACSEAFENLGELPISMKVVRAVAESEYPGPAEDRMHVSLLFSSDPIGVVDFEPTR